MSEETEKKSSYIAFIEKKLAHLPGWLKNKYFITGTLFLVWMMFFAQNDMLTQYDRMKQAKSLKNSEEHLVKEIAQTRKELDLLKTNAQTIEKYAREKYFMKKENEDLFVLPADKQN
jgi:cell division protein DivIC